MLDNLPEYLRPVIETAYIAGWRINSEILTRQKHHVDLDSGCLRLELSETNDGRGRSFPLTAGLREVLTPQLEKTAELERKVSNIIPWLFQRNAKPIKDFRKAWTAACRARLTASLRERRSSSIRGLSVFMQRTEEIRLDANLIELPARAL